VSNDDPGDLPQRLNEKLHRLFVVLIVAYVVTTSFRPVMDNVDVGWHVAQGRWMVANAAIYREDAINYATLHQPVIDEYPIFQVVLYTAWNLGWWGPCALTALGYALLLAVLIHAAWRLGLRDSSAWAMSLGLMLPFLMVGDWLRPHLASYLGIAITGAFLLRHREATRWIDFWPLALLQAVWVNCHSGFVIGPAMVGLFGAEMFLRHWIGERKFSLDKIETWLGAFLLTLLACFANPYGIARFDLPFYQDRLESIRAYVGEMEPLTGGLATICETLALIAALLIVLTIVLRRRAVCWSFLALAVVFYFEAMSVKKAWPIFGVFVPLLVLGSAAFAAQVRNQSRTLALSGVLLNFLMATAMTMGLVGLLYGPSNLSLKTAWQEHDLGRVEVCSTAVEWMKAHGIDGRLYHRCEDAGYLQQEGFDDGLTYADAGFGKYDEAFIHEVGLAEERAALLPIFLKVYQPQFVVCGNLCYRWPFYLRKADWRLVFYSPNSSVWARPDSRPDLPAVSDDEVKAAFDTDLSTYGRPVSTTFFGHNLLALNSLGLEDFAFAKLRGLPDGLHHAPWYWEAARIFCFDVPAMSPAHRNAFLSEAETLHDDGVTAEFRAYGHNADGDVDGALRILENIPPHQLGNYAAELLLKIYLDRKMPEALALARRTDCFDLRSGRHWQYLAQAEDAAGHPDAAAQAWRKAVFYYPDDPELMAGAKVFAAKTGDAQLQEDMTFTSHFRGAGLK
jgi:hypothetical protein